MLQKSEEVDYTQDNPVQATAKELGLPEELVHVVVQNYWKTVRAALENPQLLTRGINLSGYITIFFRIKAIKESLRLYQEGTSKIWQEKGIDLTIFEDLLKRYYETKAKIRNRGTGCARVGEPEQKDDSGVYNAH